jgi:hypothetical protein
MAKADLKTAAVLQWLGHGGDRAWGDERAADPLHRAGIHAKPFGNDAHTGPPRSRQGLTDSFFEGVAEQRYFVAMLEDAIFWIAIAVTVAGLVAVAVSIARG